MQQWDGMSKDGMSKDGMIKDGMGAWLQGEREPVVVFLNRGQQQRKNSDAIKERSNIQPSILPCVRDGVPLSISHHIR